MRNGELGVQLCGVGETMIWSGRWELFYVGADKDHPGSKRSRRAGPGSNDGRASWDMECTGEHVITSHPVWLCIGRDVVVVSVESDEGEGGLSEDEASQPRNGCGN